LDPGVAVTVTTLDAAVTSDAVCVRPASPDDWCRALSSDPLALPEQSPEWLRAIEATGGFRDVSRAYVRSHSAPVVVPLVRSRTGQIWSPPPAWGVGGTVGGDVDAALVQEIVTDLRTLRAARVAIRIDARHEELWQAATDAGDVTIARRSHVVELCATADEHLASLSGSARRQVRLGSRNGAVVEVDRAGRLLDEHYELFLRSVERWAGKQHEPVRLARFRAARRDPISKLRSMSEALGDRFMVVMARVDGRPASSAIVLLGPTSRYVRGAMDLELAGPTRASFAVQWRAIEEILAWGSRRYHMGESGGSEGIAGFKEKFGARPVDHHEYRFERLPLTASVDLAKRAVKRTIGFRD
jgi:hypothetical protein